MAKNKVDITGVNTKDLISLSNEEMERLFKIVKEKQLEKLYTDEKNSTCFDCDNKPAHWASISNGIFLCLECSGEHRGFGINESN